MMGIANYLYSISVNVIKLQYFRMKYTEYILTLCFLFFLSCTKDDVQKACYNEDPVEELEWLSSQISELEAGSLSEYQYIKQAEYKGELVFVFGNCCPFCGSVFSVYNCSGEKIGHLGNREEDIDFSKLENVTLIWKPNNSQCNFN